MLTNEIVGFPVINDTDFPSTLDRLTEKVKSEKKNTLKKKFKNKEKIEESENRKRKAPFDKDQKYDHKKTKVSNSTSGLEKPDWKLYKQEQKKLKETRKQKKAPSLYELSKEAKLIWEDLRQENCPKTRRAELSINLYKLIAPHIKKLVYTHDLVRVIECLFAVGGNDIRNKIFDGLKDELMTLLKNKYSVFLVLKMLKYGNKTQRSVVIKSFEGNVASLVRNPIGAPAVELAYNDYAVARERSSMIREFYGPEFRMGFYKDEISASLDVILAKYPEKREVIIKNLKKELLNVISKSPWKLTLVHTLLMEFLNHCDAESRADFVELIKNDLIHILHTRDGSKVVIMCIWNSAPKDRKMIVKSFKGHVPKICTDDYGYMVMLAIFDCIDDTVLVSKALLQEFMENIENIILSPHGRKVILYLIRPRDGMHFHPELVEFLAKGDCNQFSKKDGAVRIRELMVSIRGQLYGCFERNLDKWVDNNNILLVLKALIESSLDFVETEIDQGQITSLLVELVNAAMVEIDKVLIFKLIKNLVLNYLEKKDINSLATNFTNTLLSKLESSESSVEFWLGRKRGCLIFILLLEKGNKDLILRVQLLLSQPMKTLASSYKGNQEWKRLYELLR